MSGPYVCPNCGASLQAKDRFCRECGSDENTGWKSAEEVQYQSVDLPEEEDYQDFLEREGLAPRRKSQSVGKLALGLVLLILLILFLLR